MRIAETRDESRHDDCGERAAVDRGDLLGCREKILFCHHLQEGKEETECPLAREKQQSRRPGPHFGLTFDTYKALSSEHNFVCRLSSLVSGVRLFRKGMIKRWFVVLTFTGWSALNSLLVTICQSNASSWQEMYTRNWTLALQFILR